MHRAVFGQPPDRRDRSEQSKQPSRHREALDSADLAIMLWRFRELPDDKMKHFVDFFLSGKPIIALRTSTHAFQYAKSKTSPYAKYDWRSKDWPGGFGKQVLGETWVAHHGAHKK
jgi:hypothetical protein